ncbi:hypothetical protein P7K49_003070 [Saguinus oedipus]|uniref:Proline dehydrogenase n=1 Tax=Saguinus oedipus TaxID=9490 RepID=A0ABQ9WJ42_SAGOE|nr:hypothetical protein P7K49_003070 [Saguinus oedipus]
MALRRVLSLLRPGIPRLAPLSTAPPAREESAAGPGSVPGRGSAEAVRPPVPAVDFGNTKEAYRSRRTWELARSLLVLRLCAWPALLARHEQVRGVQAGARGSCRSREPLRSFLAWSEGSQEGRAPSPGPQSPLPGT